MTQDTKTNKSPLAGATVLVVEDDAEDARFAMKLVESLGGRVLQADTVSAARVHCAENDLAIIVLDRMLADSEDGLALLDWYRELEAAAPCVLVTSRLATIDDHVRGLDLGADDYIDKPFDLRELSARLRALMRRAETQRAPASVLIWGDLEIRTLNERALWRGETVKLRPQSFKLLCALAACRGEAVSRAALWREVWPDYKGLPPQDAVINTSINRLRKSLAELDAPPEIVSEDLGYRLVV